MLRQQNLLCKKYISQQETANEEPEKETPIRDNNPKGLVSCLRNETVIVRNINKKTGFKINDPKTCSLRRYG